MGVASGGEDERTALSGALDWYRAVVVGKLADLSTVEAKQVSTPTGMHLLGIVKHLGWVEELWFEHRFLGGPEPEVGHAESFALHPSDTLEAVITRYRAACDRSREIVEVAELDRPAAVTHPVSGTVTLRWILVHMIEETARHAGHADILRELTDGRTGD